MEIQHVPVALLITGYFVASALLGAACGYFALLWQELLSPVGLLSRLGDWLYAEAGKGRAWPAALGVCPICFGAHLSMLANVTMLVSVGYLFTDSWLIRGAAVFIGYAFSLSATHSPSKAPAPHMPPIPVHINTPDHAQASFQQSFNNPAAPGDATR